MQVSCGDGDLIKGTRIGNLKRHLQRWHSKETEELEEKETAQANKKRGKFHNNINFLYAGKVRKPV
jgi:hypothetical protein